MRKHIWDIVLAFGLAFFAPGVIGMIEETITHGSHFWIFFWPFIVGLVVALISLFHNQIINFSKRVKAKCILILRVPFLILVVKKFGDVITLLDMLDTQLNIPTNYIKLRISYIDYHTKAESPYLVCTVKVSNFLPVKVKIVKITNGHCDIDGHELPKINKDIGIGEEIERCSEGKLKFNLDVNDTQIPQILEWYKDEHRYASLNLKGEYQIEVYGHNEIREYHCEYSSIPFPSI
jgi:hypothetical protein